MQDRVAKTDMTMKQVRITNIEYIFGEAKDDTDAKGFRFVTTPMTYTKSLRT